MARPKVPLISRRKALQAALDIVDRDGLSALSIRRLGDALNVNGASLYHHFRGKDEILVGVTQLALENVTAPRSDTDGWRVWLPLNTHRTREALMAHPALIPIMLRRVPLGIGTEEVEASVHRLEQEGVPLESIIPLMESLELLAIVSALQQAGGTGGSDADPAAVEPGPSLDRAQRARALGNDEMFEILCGSVVAAVEDAIRVKQATEAGAKRPPPVRGPGPDRTDRRISGRTPTPSL